MAHAVMIPSTDMLDTYHHTSLLTRPEAKRLTQLEREMANVLSRTDLTDKQKMDLFTVTLENFRRVRGEIVNNGLMMTSTNAPQPPLQESETDDLFTKIQELIQNLNNPQQPTPPNAKTAVKTNTPATPAIKSTPKSQSPILTAQAVNLKKELVKHSAISHDAKLDKIIIGSDKYATNHVNKALVKMTSDDDINKTSPIIRLVAHKIFKNMIQSNIDMTKLAKYKFFNQLAQTTAITPRHKKSQQPLKPASRKRRSTPPPQTPSSLKKNKTGNGTTNLVNFKLWDGF
jgi:hypothetical protein